jgi:hypothetical protein
MAAARRREDEQRVAMRGPILTEEEERGLWQGDITILGPFTMRDMEDHARAIDILETKMGCFLQAEPTGVDRGEASPVAGKSDGVKNHSHLIDAEDGWELLLARGANQGEGGEVSVEGLLEEELDGADGDGGGAAGVVFDIPDVEEVLAQFFLSDQVG